MDAGRRMVGLVSCRGIVGDKEPADAVAVVVVTATEREATDEVEDDSDVEEDEDDKEALYILGAGGSGRRQFSHVL